ncbi:MBOAT family protein [Tannerella sp.]|uniref:MBOAT family O-acyltransferase n=1 Tax=Tannerella sp. TaxID=2382127 RepID=UPI0026DAE64A|nr:MBOAT family O-acyltransferase [Tannerella sp.]MDO4704230.1 MBOAT family O-acyltransferase [Tannerella sp.]
MLFSTGLFFFLFIVFFAVYRSLRQATTARIVYVTLFSLYFYYKSSGVWFALLIFTATSDFLIARAIAQTSRKGLRKAWVALSVCINIGMLAYFKYTNFLYDLGVMLLSSIGQWIGNAEWSQMTYSPLDIFLPVGISFFTFQSLSYTIDVYRNRLEPLNRWIDYLFYVSFFPGLVAGPIVRARDFIPQMFRSPRLSKEHLGEGLYLIICGLFKKCVISDYISINFVDRIFDAPTLYTGLENLFGVYGYALQIYCDFSGYSDMAIGIALLMGIRFNVNFDSPYQSATITEFWRRWHISLSSWLKDYLYISMGGNRKGKFRTYVNLIVTMLLGGLWHGASMRFILWGALHGVALAGHKFVMSRFSSFKPEGEQMSSVRRLAGMILTFHLVCLGWVFFRADTVQIGTDVLTRIFTDFHPEVFTQFVVGYPGVSVLIVTGYLLHFVPKHIDLKMQRVVTESPMLVQALYLILAIFIVIQVKSSGVVPFIYFQF